jgi:anion-transporting  ArsA/GET3 family ATPase
MAFSVPARSPRMPVTGTSLTQSRLVVVSGKGGVGKTTVAVALARAASVAGKRTLVVEVEQRQSLAPLLGVNPLEYEERKVGPNLWALSVEPDEALVEYLYLFYGIKRVARPLVSSRAVEFATNTAPGLRDILLVGKVKEAETRRSHGRYVYDLIVLDAPPTGRLPRFLNAPRAVADLVPSGVIRQQAKGLIDLLFDPRRCRVALVTTPEEMPVRETIESVANLRDMGLAFAPVVVNAVYPRPFSPAQERTLVKDGTAALTAEAEAAGITLRPAEAGALVSTARAHVRRAKNQKAAIAELASEVDLPRVTLPWLFTATVGPEEVGLLAESLVAQGAV